jgi:hypothetical protein
MCDPPKALWQISLVAKGEATCKSSWILIDYAIFTGGACVWMSSELPITNLYQLSRHLLIYTWPFIRPPSC